MGSRGIDSVIEKRQLMRAAAEVLAGALEGEGREAFLASAEARINRTYPAPSPANMRAYLKLNVVR